MGGRFEGALADIRRGRERVHSLGVEWELIVLMGTRRD